MDHLNEKIDPGKILNLQKYQYAERLYIHGQVPANTSRVGTVTVSNLGDFMCQFITGSFTTLALNIAAIVDTQVNYLSGQLIDGNGNKRLFNTRIPFQLLLSPGRRKDATSSTVLTDPVGNNLFYPLPFEYLFPASTQIQMDVNNTSDTDNYYEITLHGFRVLGKTTLEGRDSNEITVV
jgi:hypothetical protein